MSHEIILRDYQELSVQRLRENIRAGIKNQVLCAPTGSGKTLVAAHLLKEAHGKEKRAIFVADSIALIDQTSQTLDRYGIPHGVMQGQHWRWRPDALIQVASAQTIMRRGWPDADLVILDECHISRKIINDRIKDRDTVAIGLTATPFARGMGKHYDAVVSVTTTNRLTNDGHLVSFRAFSASEPDMTGAKVVAGEWSDDVAAERAIPIVGDCVAEYLKHGNEKKFIAFGCNVAHCTALHEQFMAAGVRTDMYTYRTDDEEREKMIQEYRRPDSEIRGLISVSALAKGFDVSDVGVIIMARPLKSSLAEHIQILGRGLRPHHDKQDCLVLDHAGNMLRFWDAMQEFFENGAQELDDGKPKPEKKTKEKDAREPMKCAKCSHVHDPLPKCPACGYVYPQRKNKVVHETGELSEIGGKAKLENKQEVYSQLLAIARARGYNDGWTAHKYKARFGVWPRGMIDAEIAPSEHIVRWVRKQQASFSKSQKVAA